MYNHKRIKPYHLNASIYFSAHCGISVKQYVYMLHVIYCDRKYVHNISLSIKKLYALYFTD